MKILIKWIILALSILGVQYIVPGISVSSFYTALIAAFFLGLVNLIIRPIILVLTLPINILTLGLFTLVVNGMLFWFLSTFIKGFQVSGFVAAVLGALVVAVSSHVADRLLIGKKKD